MKTALDALEISSLFNPTSENAAVTERHDSAVDQRPDQGFERTSETNASDPVKTPVGPAADAGLSPERRKKLEKGALAREARTMASMIDIYCRGHHAEQRPAAGGLCPECEELKAYAMKRLACCPFGEGKPVCAKCRVHCYKPQMKEKIAAVMRYAGPRVVVKHPILSLEHLWKSLFVTPPEKPRAKPRKG